MGYCPSARLFEAAACGVPLISDEWLGLERFFEPEREIVVVRSTEDVVAALERAPVELAKMASRARARVLAEHTAEHRARELVEILRDTPPRTVREPLASVAET